MNKMERWTFLAIVTLAFLLSLPIGYRALSKFTKLSASRRAEIRQSLLTVLGNERKGEILDWRRNVHGESRWEPIYFPLFMAGLILTIEFVSIVLSGNSPQSPVSELVAVVLLFGGGYGIQIAIVFSSLRPIDEAYRVNESGITRAKQRYGREVDLSTMEWRSITRVTKRYDYFPNIAVGEALVLVSRNGHYDVSTGLANFIHLCKLLVEKVPPELYEGRTWDYVAEISL